MILLAGSHRFSAKERSIRAKRAIRTRLGDAHFLLSVVRAALLAVLASPATSGEAARDLFGYRLNAPPCTYDVVASDEGRAIEFSGKICPGAARALQSVLRGDGRAARVLRLAGPGGDAREAVLMAISVRRRELDTHVSLSCASACTVVYLAGRMRTLKRGARLGFHRGRNPIDGADVPLPWIVVTALDAAGIASWFVERINRTPNAEAWWPTEEELIAANAVHSITDDGPSATAETPAP